MSRVSQGNHSNSANVIFFPLFKACLLVHLLSLCQGQGSSFGSWLQCYDVKKEVNGATSVIWMKQKTQKGGLLNLIYKYFEPVPPLIMSLTSDRNTFVETFSPNARARVVSVADCLTALCSAPTWWQWMRVYRMPPGAAAWYQFIQGVTDVSFTEMMYTTFENHHWGLNRFISLFPTKVKKCCFSWPHACLAALLFQQKCWMEIKLWGTFCIQCT